MIEAKTKLFDTSKLPDVSFPSYNSPVTLSYTDFFPGS